MTVGKLIELLQELPKDSEVVITYLSVLGEDVELDPDPIYYENQNRVYL